MKTIYVLLDPRDHYTAYIGRSKHIRRRLTEHLHAKQNVYNPRLTFWFEELTSIGLRPILREIMHVSDDESLSWESYWINDYASRGFRVLNILSLSPSLPENGKKHISNTTHRKKAF